jgi:hypothetical protein
MQVQKMFEASNVPWRLRLPASMDQLMTDAPDQLLPLAV